MKLNAIERKKFRVTNKVKKVSSPDRLRLSISRSSKNISAQIIDDVKNITLLSSSSVEKDVKAMSKVNKTEISKIVAEKLAKKAVEKKITTGAIITHIMGKKPKSNEKSYYSEIGTFEKRMWFWDFEIMQIPKFVLTSIICKCEKKIPFEIRFVFPRINRYPSV